MVFMECCQSRHGYAQVVARYGAGRRRPPSNLKQCRWAPPDYLGSKPPVGACRRVFVQHTLVPRLVLPSTRLRNLSGCVARRVLRSLDPTRNRYSVIKVAQKRKETRQFRRAPAQSWNTRPSDHRDLPIPNAPHERSRKAHRMSRRASLGYVAAFTGWMFLPSGSWSCPLDAQGIRVL